MASRVGFRLEGTRELAERLGEYAVTRHRQVVGAMFAEAETEMREMKRQTPVDTGALRSSGHVVPPETRGRTTVVEMGFGGPAAPYAIPVHEDLEAFHPVGNAKFMERPLTESAPFLLGRVVRRVEAEPA